MLFVVAAPFVALSVWDDHAHCPCDDDAAARSRYVAVRLLAGFALLQVWLHLRLRQLRRRDEPRARLLRRR